MSIMKNENTKKMLAVLACVIGSLGIACILSIIPSATVPISTYYLSFNFYESRSFYFISLLLLSILCILIKEKQSGFSAVTACMAGCCSVLGFTVYCAVADLLFDIIYAALQPQFAQPQTVFTAFYCIMASVISCVYLVGEILFFKLSLIIAKIKPSNFIKPAKGSVIFMVIVLAIKILLTFFYVLTALPTTAHSIAGLQMILLYLNQIFDVAVLVFIAVKAFKAKTEAIK